MKDVKNYLINFGLSKTEASVYTILLKIGRANGYQITKELGISKSTVYQALNSMCKNGYIFMYSGVTKEYEAKDPKLLFLDFEKNYSENKKGLEEAINKLVPKKETTFFYRFEEKENIRKTIYEIINLAQREIYISTDFDLEEYQELFLKTISKGIRIILVTNNRKNGINLKSDLYYENCFTNCILNTKFLIVVDMKYCSVITCSKYQINGIYTNDNIFTEIILENIYRKIEKIENKKEELLKRDIKVSSLCEVSNIMG